MCSMKVSALCVLLLIVVKYGRGAILNIYLEKFGFVDSPLLSKCGVRTEHSVQRTQSELIYWAQRCVQLQSACSFFVIGENKCDFYDAALIDNYSKLSPYDGTNRLAYTIRATNQNPPVDHALFKPLTPNDPWDATYSDVSILTSGFHCGTFPEDCYCSTLDSSYVTVDFGAPLTIRKVITVGPIGFDLPLFNDIDILLGNAGDTSDPTVSSRSSGPPTVDRQVFEANFEETGRYLTVMTNTPGTLRRALCMCSLQVFTEP